MLHHMDTFYNTVNVKWKWGICISLSLHCISLSVGSSTVDSRIFSRTWKWSYRYRKTAYNINPPAYSSVSAWQNTAASFFRYIIQLSLCRIVVTLYLVAMATALSSGEYWSVRNPCASVCAAIGAFLSIHSPARASENERETKQALNWLRSVFWGASCHGKGCQGFKNELFD